MKKTRSKHSYFKAIAASTCAFAACWIGLSVVGGNAIGQSPGAITFDQSNGPSVVDSLDPSIKASIEQADGLSRAFEAVSEAVLPSVVAIETRTEVAQAPINSPQQKNIKPSNQDPFGGRNPFEGTPFEDFFGPDGFNGAPFAMPPGGKMQPFGKSNPKGHMTPSRGIGSGVIIDESGIILTNNHVVSGGTKVIVKTHDGREYEAVEVLTDPTTDIAIVRIDGASNLQAARFGDSDSARVGQWVMALGQPFGLESTVTAGIISAKQRGIGITDRENFLQTDASINPGSSGGPLVNLHGGIVGINTAIHSRSGGNDGIGFSVPSNMARWVAEQLVNDGKVRRAYLGVGIQAVNQELAQQMNIPPRSGVVITDVFDETPAKDIGLQSGDIIVEFGGQPVTTSLELQRLVEKSPFESSVEMTIVRNGERIKLDYVPTERPSEFGKLAESQKIETPQQAASMPWGIAVSEIDAKLARQLNLSSDEGVVITDVEGNSEAEAAGLQSGMVIKQVDRQPVQSVEDFARLISKADQDVLLLVANEQGSRFVVLTK